MKRFFPSLLLVVLLSCFLALSGCAPKELPVESSTPPAFAPAESSQAVDEESSEPAPEASALPYPVGKMFVSQERLVYRDGDLVLRVPRLNLETRVVGGFSAQVQEKLQSGTMTRQERIDFFGNSEGDLLLKTGVVLLNSSPLPDPLIPNPNISISGHRDVDGSEFYDIHKLTTGDMVYLTYGGREYAYAWQSTVVHQSNDWSITYCGDDSIVSLISCDPIGTSRNRIVAIAKLSSVTETEPQPESSQPSGHAAPQPESTAL